MADLLAVSGKQERLAAVRAARPDLPARLLTMQESTRALLPLQALVARAQDVLERARQARLQDDRALRGASESAAARILVARLKGALQVVSELGNAEPVDDEAERILAAAKTILAKLASDAT